MTSEAVGANGGHAGHAHREGRRRRSLAFRSSAVLLCWLLSAGIAAAQTLAVWVHAGPGPERDGYLATVKAFNAIEAQFSRPVRAELVTLAEGSYPAEVERAAARNQLPCVLEFDGPQLAAQAAAGRLRALDEIPALNQVRASMLGSLVRQGTYNGRFYGMGQYDSGLALWGNRQMLAAAGVRIPVRAGDGWTLAEFEEAMRRLKAAGVAAPLDMKFNYGIGEWLTYGFAPIVQGFGGDLIDRETLRSAQGTINGPAAVKALTTLQGWVRGGWVDPQPKDDRDFVTGRSALSWVGHWAYGDYKKALGNDLVLMPMPRFGPRTVTGSGSWNFGIAASCTQPEAAARFLAHLMSRAEILRITEVNGAVPGTGAAMAFSRAYAQGGELRLFADQLLSGHARVRPVTPDYPAITTAFAQAVAEISRGANVQTMLDRAARQIDEAIAKRLAQEKAAGGAVN